MQDYQHTVQYYETDRMGITHHSNYIRWMEEARVAFLQSIGWGYERFEAMGVVSPVVQLSCSYKNTTTFADTVTIRLSVAACTGVRLSFHYVMTKQDGAVVCADRDGKSFEIPCDSVISCAGYLPAPLSAAGKKNVQGIGDCRSVGNLRSVIWSAYEAAMQV